MFRPVKRSDELRLLKAVYLTNEEVWYRALSDHRTISARDEILTAIYEPLALESERHRKLFRNHYIIVALGFCVSLGLISELAFSGATFSERSLSLALLLGMGISSFYLGLSIVRTNAASGIFQKVFKNSDAGGRSYLLLRYPEAFGPHHYFVSPNLHTRFHTGVNELWRQIPFVFLALGAALFMLIVPAFVFFSLASVAWGLSDGSYWARALIISSGFAVFGSWLLPTKSFSKKRYDHSGLVYQLDRVERENPEFYRRMCAWLDRIERHRTGVGDD